MAKTPEGRVKDLVKDLLKECGLVQSSKAAEATTENTGWYHMPVSNGMGVQGINDFYGHYKGWYFTIETKVPGKEPTALQQHQIDATGKTGGATFVVRCREDLEEIERFFRYVDGQKTHAVRIR